MYMTTLKGVQYIKKVQLFISSKTGILTVAIFKYFCISSEKPYCTKNTKFNLVMTLNYCTQLLQKLTINSDYKHQ